MMGVHIKVVRFARMVCTCKEIAERSRRLRARGESK